MTNELDPMPYYRVEEDDYLQEHMEAAEKLMDRQEAQAKDWHITCFIRLDALPEAIRSFGFNLWHHFRTLDPKPIDHWELQVDGRGGWRFLWNDVATPWSVNTLETGAVYEMSAGWNGQALICTLTHFVTREWEQVHYFLKKRPPPSPWSGSPRLDLTLQDYAVFGRALRQEEVARLFGAAKEQADGK